MPDYIAIKFIPRATGSYLISFYEKPTNKILASSPYKIILHEDYKEIIKCSGAFDLSRLRISASNLPSNYDLSEVLVVVKGIDFQIVLFLFSRSLSNINLAKNIDPKDVAINSCFFSNDKCDLVIEFVSRIEGLHNVFIYLNGELVDDKPFTLHVQSNQFDVANLSMMTKLSYNTDESVEKSFSDKSLVSTESHVDYPIIVHNEPIRCAKTNQIFYYVTNDQNIQGLCIYGNWAKIKSKHVNNFNFFCLFCNQ